MRLLLFIFILLQAYQSSADSNPQPLRVGMSMAFPPYAYEVAGKLQGIEVDLARLLSARLNRELEIKTYTFDKLIQKLEAGEIDIIMSGLSITDERKKRVSFTNSFLQIGQMVIVHIEEAPKLADTNSLGQPGIKLGVQRGTTGEIYVLESFPSAELVSFNGVEDALDALRNKRIDAFVHDSTTSWQLGDSFINDRLISLNRTLTTESIAWAVNRENSELLLVVNLVMETLKDDDSVNQVLLRWLPGLPVSAIQAKPPS